MGAKGRAGKATRMRLVSALGLLPLAADSDFAAYRDAGDEFVRHHLAELAREPVARLDLGRRASWRARVCSSRRRGSSPTVRRRMVTRSFSRSPQPSRMTAAKS